MTTEYHSAGKTTLTHDVLLTIASQAALEVEGVHAMAPVKGGVNNLFRRGGQGVQMRIEDNNVFVDLYLVLGSEINMREVSRKVQLAVARAITEMTGLVTSHVNVHIEDIFYKAED